MAMLDNPRMQTSTSGGVVVVVLRTPKITDFEVPAIKSDLAELMKEHGGRLLLDLSNVLLIGSSGLGLLITLKRDAEAAGGKLVICNVSEEIMGMIKITHLQKVLTFAADAKAGLKAF